MSRWGCSKKDYLRSIGLWLLNSADVDSESRYYRFLGKTLVSFNVSTVAFASVATIRKYTQEHLKDKWFVKFL